MNTRFLQVMLLAGLTALPVLATADHDDGRWNGSAIQWREGHGTSIYYRYPGERDWRRAPGSAHDVGDGWVIGTDRRNGGYGIYRWSGNNWQRMPGAAVQIGGSYQNPWVINDRGERFVWTGYDWREQGRERSYRRDDYNRWDRDDDRHDNRHNDNRRNSWRDGRGR